MGKIYIFSSAYGEAKRKVFFIWSCQNDSSVPDGKHKMNPRVVVTILDAVNATMRHGDPQHDDLVMLLH